MTHHNRHTFSLLPFAAVLTGYFVLLAVTTWFVLQTTNPLDVGALVSWYSALTSVVALVGLATWLINRTPYQPLIPRLHLLAVFAVWVTTIVGAGLSNSVAVVYLCKLLEAPLLATLLTLLAFRIHNAFTPHLRTHWLWVSTVILGVPALLLTATPLNVTPVMDGGSVTFVDGWIHTGMIVAGFTVFFISVCLIPLGRQRYAAHPTLSVGPLIFAAATNATDTNLRQTLEELIHTYRRVALKRGQWIHWRNHLHNHHGIISTQPQVCTAALSTLLEYALHKNQTRAIAVALLPDTRHSYVHCRIDYTVNTHSKREFTDFAEQFSTLGGHLTVQRDTRDTTLIVSFPLQW